MGVDVTAYSHMMSTDEVLPLEVDGTYDATDKSDEWHDDLHETRRVVAFCYSAFIEHALAGLTPGAVYAPTSATVSDRFFSASYSGYGRFREQLAEVGMGTQPQDVWADPPSFSDCPFFELVHFADNEGVLGPVAAKALHEDFVAQRGMFLASVAHIGDQGWFIASYDAWTKGTALAADDGLIRFS